MKEMESQDVENKLKVIMGEMVEGRNKLGD